MASGIVMLLVPSGHLPMDSPRTEHGRESREFGPSCTIGKAFYLSQSGVSNAEWLAIASAHAGGLWGGDMPAVGVSWNDV